MLRLAADENFNKNIVRGVHGRNADIDIEDVQGAGLSGADDPTVLEWAARSGRLLLTHDAETMIDFAYDRVRANLPMPGVCVVGLHVPIKVAIDELLLVAECSHDGEWQGRVIYLPLQQAAP